MRTLVTEPIELAVWSRRKYEKKKKEKEKEEKKRNKGEKKKKRRAGNATKIENSPNSRVHSMVTGKSAH
jgi:hypothetical protein